MKAPGILLLAVAASLARLEGGGSAAHIRVPEGFVIEKVSRQCIWRTRAEMQ